MKKQALIFTALFLISAIFSVQSLSGQEKTTAEKEKELKLQQAIELQKKAMADQQKAIDQQNKDLDRAVQDANRNANRQNDGGNFYRSRVRSSGNALEGFEEQPFVISPGIAYYSHEGDSERTTWDFSKQVKETTFSRDYSFDVEESANTVVMTVMGDCKSGQIRVKILMPGGKLYSDIVIDEFGNLNWRKSFTISEEENKDKAGEWKFKIDAEKATGFFKISLQTY
jgi:type II secretory pathway pseudopilin PulG